MRFTLTIDCDGAAFDPDPEDEICRILDKLVTEIGHVGPFEGETRGSLRDTNGNRVGAWTFGPVPGTVVHDNGPALQHIAEIRPRERAKREERERHGE